MLSRLCERFFRSNQRNFSVLSGRRMTEAGHKRTLGSTLHNHYETYIHGHSTGRLAHYNQTLIRSSECMIHT
jgi:hypothetical protein